MTTALHELAHRTRLHQRHERAERLRGLAEWLDLGANPSPDALALDYYRLAHRLDELADDARKMARIYLPSPEGAR